ncbi:avidin/streptavidin family protein [Hellea balneolensis]|uniref:avidin/streptavidin family protein n=1 Tax=Hellea balneolensis TaxID=287478 RepID=UPI0004143BE6|nr:avidin/streptavidin family protein [Hellea balneolensis]
MFRKLGVSIGALALSSCAQAQDTQPNLFEGQWVNDRDSAVTFDVTDGLLSGHYQTALGQPDKSKKFPLTGFVEGDQITFTVNFKGYGSLTSWTGQLTADEQGDYIRTLWNLTRDVEDAAEDEDLWQSITSGASDFRRMED